MEERDFAWFEVKICFRRISYIAQPHRVCLQKNGQMYGKSGEGNKNDNGQMQTKSFLMDFEFYGFVAWLQIFEVCKIVTDWTDGQTNKVTLQTMALQI